MQDSKTSQPRKPWYQKAMEIATLWKTSPKSPEKIPAVPNSDRGKQLRKCTSLRVATSFTRVCLCAPISSYDEVFYTYAPPRRSSSYPPSRQFQVQTTSSIQAKVVAAQRGRMSADLGRRIFRGKSLTDDVLMRRFVVEEEAMMQDRRRNQMEVIRRRSLMRRKKLGPSPLSRMVLTEHDEDQDNR